MKQKILTLVIGMLIGAIIATIGFIIYTKVTAKNNNNGPQMVDGKFQMQDGGRQNMKGGMQEGNPNKQKNTNTDNTVNTEYAQPPELPNGETPSGQMPLGNMPQDALTDMQNGTPPAMKNNL